MTIRAERIADLCVVGAGIFGLSVARAARARGLSVRLLEAAAIGAGASGGIVGALSPHVPEQWNPKKQFQLDALLSAADHWARVDSESGLSSGHARTGRLLPLPDAAARSLAEARTDSARLHWGDAARWELIEAPGWLAPHAPAGCVFETLSGRIFPRRACRSLAAACRRAGVEIVTGMPAQAVGSGCVHTRTGPLPAGQIVVAAGVPGFALMADRIGPRAGSGVKGQAALLRHALPGDHPVLFHDGLYIVPHDGGTVAVGSTSEPRYDDPTGTDAQLDTLLVRARAVMPPLRDAPVIERWAGLRPKARRRDPMLGPVPGLDGVYLATGAFKIGFGIAHEVGEVLADFLTGQDPVLPDSFTVEHHMEAAHAPARRD